MNSKTITLADEHEDPSITIMKGHVSAEEFNAAWLADGGGEPVAPEEIKHEYWIMGNDEDGVVQYRKASGPFEQGALAYTAVEW